MNHINYTIFSSQNGEICGKISSDSLNITFGHLTFISLNSCHILNVSLLQFYLTLFQC